MSQNAARAPLLAHAQGSVSGQVKELVGQVVQGCKEVAVLGHVRQADLASDGVLELRGGKECGHSERVRELGIGEARGARFLCGRQKEGSCCALALETHLKVHCGRRRHEDLLACC